MSMEQMSDEQLAGAYARGDADAFDALYARYRQPLFGWLKRSSSRSQEEVEEVFQDTWVKVIRGMERFDASRRFAPWLFRIARNCMIDRWRHLAAVNELQIADQDAVMNAADGDGNRPEARLHGEELAARWEAALAALPALQREALLLKLETDFDLDTLAATLGAPRETVKSRLRYAMQRLRARFEEIFNE